MASDMLDWEMQATLPIVIKPIVITGQPKNLILLEDSKLPEFPLHYADTCLEATRNYVKWNFGFCEPFVDMRLICIDDSISDYRSMYMYYSIIIAEENNVKQGKWHDILEACGIVKTQADAEAIKQGVLKWVY